jgi:hypothetical protein
MIYCNLIIYALIAILVSVETAVEVPEYFGKDEKMDKLVIKNKIAYHFKKLVKEVSQELFVSRKMDVSLLFQGIQVLKKTESEIRRLCDNLPNRMNTVVSAAIEIPAPEPLYTLIRDPMHAGFAEARARCTALGKQLPEVYDGTQIHELTKFLKANGITKCFAGIVPDVIDSIHRHISTGYPVWNTAYKLLYSSDNGNATSLHYYMDDVFAKFVYTSDGKMAVSLDNHTSAEANKFGNHQFRKDNPYLSQLMMKIVCEPKWNGQKNIILTSSNMAQGNIEVLTRYHRSVNTTRSVISNNKAELSGMKSVQTLCFSIAEQAKESHEEMQSKLTDLLALVDISVHTEMARGTRKKRIVPLFLAKFIFVTGVKLLWQLFGFVQKVKMNNRLKNLEQTLQVVENRSQQNSDAINNMTRLIYGNSVAIGQLSIRVDNLEVRLSVMEKQVGSLWEKFTDLAYRFEAVNALNIVENLIIRVRQSMEGGYSILKDIIHSAKIGQTSPLVLPIDQMELVQNEIAKISTAVLDPDFAKMQSIVVSDPSDPTLLLVVVNMAALSRRNLELVKMIPVPFFEDQGAYQISLDYHTIVLDQSSHSFSILTEQEEYDCMFNRCYVGSSEQSLLEPSCGIPQYYDRQKDSCLSDTVATSGVYLKPVLPDGVIFAFREEVQTQVFCKDKLVGNTKKLRGTGVLQLPNGCVLSVVDKHGKVTKVKGQPQYTMVTAHNIELMPNGPLSAMNVDVDTNDTQKVANVNAFVEKHVSSVVRQVENVDLKVTTQHTHVWSLTAIILAIMLASCFTVLLVYRCSNRARDKLRTLRNNVAEISQHMFNPEAGLPDQTEDVGSTPASPRRKRDVLREQIRDQRQRALRHLHVREQPIVKGREPLYMSMNELYSQERRDRYVPSLTSFKPLTSLREIPRAYPSLSPLMTQKEFELNRELEEETELVEALCVATSPRMTSKYEHQ